MIRKLFKIFVVITAGFFYFVSFLQIQDHFVGYGFVSIGIGTTILILAFGRKYFVRRSVK